MAFDGITISALVCELKKALKNGHIRKIAQPEPDELLLTIQAPAASHASDGVKRPTYKLKLSANASLPLLYLTESNKPSPATAPNFCMLLRKHISGSRIEDISQAGFERCVRLVLSSKNELGDPVLFSLVIEIMGKHSNIIFLDEKDNIIDSIKHVNAFMSTVREVLPGRQYFIPNTLDKKSPLEITTQDWNEYIFAKPSSVAKAISGSLTGMSMTMAHELCNLAHVDGDDSTSSLNGNDRSAIMDAFRNLMEDIGSDNFSPVIYYDNDVPKEFSAVPLTMYQHLDHDESESISQVVERFYLEKDNKTRMKHKSADLTQTVKTYLERSVKKLGILEKQMKDTEKMDKFKEYGELITTYGYTLLPPLPVDPGYESDNSEGDNTDKSSGLKLHCENYHSGKEVDIPIDPTLSVPDNANKYFEKYNKLKRTREAVTEQLSQTRAETEHLDSVLTEIMLARSESDLAAIRAELTDSGYLKKQTGRKKQKMVKSPPLRFISSDGYEILVGRNNYQNEELTFKVATGNDWWFHAKQMPGSHVIVLSHGEEPPIHTFEEAAALAALFSKGSGAEKLEIDYTQKKNVKKPGSGGKPGFVIYYTNYSILASKEYLKRVKPDGKEEEAYL